MTSVLESARQKLIRGDEHLKSLHREIEAYSGRHPYAVVGEFDPQTSEYVFRVRILEDPPERLSVIGGDAIHNFRSALDQIAHRLVDANGHTPTGRTAFPIVDNPSDFPAPTNDKVVGMSPDHLALVEVMQPYHGGNPEYSLFLRESISTLGVHPLAFMPDLSNQDKHRELHTVVGMSDVRTPQFRMLRDVGSIGAYTAGISRTSQGHSTLDDGAEIGRVLVVTPGPNPVVKMYDELYPRVTMSNGIEYDTCLSFCKWVVAGIFHTFVSVLN